MATRADKERLAVAFAMLLAVMGLIRIGQLGASDIRHAGFPGAAAMAAP
ncbi:hypothetical protein [Sphingosinicella humi]|nr:hypothetical protein [Sphingosinicella humi]